MERKREEVKIKKNLKWRKRKEVKIKKKLKWRKKEKK
jgi:hypothetical protein